jgi:hypothetical protein
MRKLLYFILFTGMLYSQNVRVQDYQVPVSTAQNLRFNGNWDWLQRDSVLTNSARANLFYRSFYSSLPLAWFINVDASGTKNKGSYGHDVLINASFNKYIWPNADAFGFAEINAAHINTYRQIASDLTVGFGYGRYINATALAKAVRIEEHLIREKVIAGYLPRDVMISIANIIERESEFRTLYGDQTYETYWLDAIEDEIKTTDELMDENIGSVGILRMHQVLFNINERVNQRYYGWNVTAGILFPLTRADRSPAGNPNLVAGGRYSLPLSWQFQVNAIARIFTPLDTAFAKSVTSDIGVDFIYELSNKINFVTNYSIGTFKQVNAETIISHRLGSSFLFYLENNIYFTVNANMIRLGRSPSTLSTNVGLQYNLF